MIDFTNAETLERLADLIADRVAGRVAAEARRKYVSREEYARIHDIGVRTVDRAIKQNRLPVRRTGSRVQIDPNAEIENPK